MNWRNNNRDIANPAPRGSEALVWQNSVYGQVLICPLNFKDYNDGVLHAALLRGSKNSELSYDTDTTLSEEMLEVLLNEVDHWTRGEGQALGEFCMAIATKRLKLKGLHLDEFQRVLKSTAAVPDWIKRLCLNIDMEFSS